MTRLTFLGTGGGRFATIYQLRSTGGMYLEDGASIHVDPGPSAAWSLARLDMDPADTDAVLISHGHPDHYGDAEIIIEGMTRGGLIHRGALYGSRSVIDGAGGIGPAISNYHRSLVKEVGLVEPGSRFSVGNIDVQATFTDHSDPTGVGFRFNTINGMVSYVSDTQPHPRLAKEHQGSRALVLAITRPRDQRVRCHLCTEDAVDLIRSVKPEIVILSHMGVRMIREGPEKEAKWLEDRTGVRCHAADDGDVVTLGNDISISRGHPILNE